MGLHRPRAARRRRVGRLRRPVHPRGDRHAARRLPRLPGTREPRRDDGGRGGGRGGRRFDRLRDRPPVRRAAQAQPTGPPGRPGPLGQGRGLPARQGRPGGVPGPFRRRVARAGARACRHVPHALPHLPALERRRWAHLGPRVRTPRLLGRQLLPAGRAHRRPGQPPAPHPGGGRGRGRAGRPLHRPPPRPPPRSGRPATRAPMGRAAAEPLSAPARLPGPPAAPRRRARPVADRQRARPGRGRLGVRGSAPGRRRRRRGRAARWAGAALLRRPPGGLAHPGLACLTDLGNAAVLIGLILAVGLVWWWRRRTWRPLWLLAGAYLGAWVLSETVKDLTHRARPPAAQAIGHWTGFAFPSGHTTKATAVYGMLAALLAATTPRWGRKVSVWTAAALLAGLVGLSRLYLGAHWLTDVLGALTLGAAWLFVLLTATRTVDALHAAPSDEHPTPAHRQPPRQREIPAEDAAPVEPARPVRRNREAR